MNKIELRGLSTVSFYADNHEEAKKWYSEILGMDPYFNAPGYSEFRLGDYQHELGIIDGKYVIGEMEKLEAHRKAQLHRAVSVFIFNSKGELLLQKRAESKYHSPGLWINTACTHPRPNERNEDAAARRLDEEMGMNQIKLTKLFDFYIQRKF